MYFTMWNKSLWKSHYHMISTVWDSGKVKNKTKNKALWMYWKDQFLSGSGGKRSWTGWTQRTSRVMGLFQMVQEWIISFCICWVFPECTATNSEPKHKLQIWIDKDSQFRFNDESKCMTVMQNAWLRHGMCIVGYKIHRSLVLSAQFCWEPRIAL